MSTRLKPVPKVVREGQDPLSSDEGDFEIECTINRPPLVPDGNYELAFIRVDRKKNLWGRMKLFLHFKIMNPGEHFGKVLFMAVNIPPNGNFSISSKFLQQWVIAAGFHPGRRDRLSTRVFRGKVFFGAVRTVTQYVHSSKKMMDRDPESFYSVVDHLIERRTGL
ncbi:MAG: hypothetical protein JSR31_07215 [Nitrospira sp.]|nr:hypothetical protein [Nitrospira sp.]